MTFVLPIDSVGPKQRKLVGGKSYSLSVLKRQGFRVPRTWCVTTKAYQYFVSATGLKPQILVELNRKKFKDQRWEELWDSSLRIRSLFAKTDMPVDLAASLNSILGPELPERCVVRSSAPGEDSRRASFAGLHASFVNVVGMEAVLEHLKLVWASLWSDAALLYRREMKLDVEKSTMAVIVQELAPGEKSGVAFGQNPQDASQAVIEAVYGLNQGLVDGTVEPDRWLLERASGKVISFRAADRGNVVMPASSGVHLEMLLPEGAGTPPLSDTEVGQVFDLACQSEDIFGAPQDMEWTYARDLLYVLQSRPITTLKKAAKGDQRPWYLSLRRSFGNLKALRREVENELIPAMDAEANQLAALDLTHLSAQELQAEIRHRARVYKKWKDVYWSEFIPLAHGIRLFGVVYNDVLKPQDPYEFMDLLGASGMMSLERNRRLEGMAGLLRENPKLIKEVQSHQIQDFELNRAMQKFVEDFGDLFCGASSCSQDMPTLGELLMEMAARPPRPERFDVRDVTELRERFLSHFTGKKLTEAKELLDLARASYRLRDDDNLHLGRIQAQLHRVMAEVERRGRAGETIQLRLPRDVQDILAELEEKPPEDSLGANEVIGVQLKARQIVGQPAGPGLAQGHARVILTPTDLFQFKAGEILVCDAVDPSMTFVVPLATAIVERRGGMLIHGSIIAREYGIPCVTGVPNATTLIHTSNNLTVDGYLGIVTVA
jgi:pyruvate,water dikinase